MRVLQVTDWNPSPGGVETYVRDLVPALEAAGITVRALTSSAGTAMDGDADFVAWGTANPVAQAGLQLINPFAWVRMREALDRFRPDVVHVHSFAYHLSPAVLFAARNVPVVMTIHDYKPICPLGTKLLPDGRRCAERAGVVCWKSGCLSAPHWLREQPRSALIRRALGGARRLLVGSEWMRRTLAGEGVDGEVVRFPVSPPSAGYVRRLAERPTFLYCGRLAPEKGVALLLRAFGRLLSQAPTSRLLLAGDGPERARLQRLAAELGVEGAVHFGGWQSPAAVERLMAQASALVAPSLWAEPFGIVAVEAICRGVPVVASAPGGLAETVVHGISGLTFPAGSEDGLHRCLLSFARGEVFPTAAIDPAVVAAVREAHAPERHVERLQAVYERALAGGDDGGWQADGRQPGS